MKKEELIRRQFQNILDKLVGSKIQPTATAIISAEQPMIMLFEELMCEINKLQKESEKLKKQVKNEIYVRDSIASLTSNLKLENQKLKRKLKEIETIVDTRPYVAYNFYGNILYESDEILKILKGE